MLEYRHRSASRFFRLFGKPPSSILHTLQKVGSRLSSAEVAEHDRGLEPAGRGLAICLGQQFVLGAQPRSGRLQLLSNEIEVRSV